MAARRQPNANSESVDNYLKAILVLSGSEEHRVTSTALSDRLGVAPASVTNMLQKLAAGLPPLVEYERHHGVLLSVAGKRRALEVVRHHRLIETFLYEVLDYPLEEVHEEAERLEHFISERFEERIEAKLAWALHPRNGRENAQGEFHTAVAGRGERDFCGGQHLRPRCSNSEVAQHKRHCPRRPITGQSPARR